MGDRVSFATGNNGTDSSGWNGFAAKFTVGSAPDPAELYTPILTLAQLSYIYWRVKTWEVYFLSTDPDDIVILEETVYSKRFVTVDASEVASERQLGTHCAASTETPTNDPVGFFLWGRWVNTPPPEISMNPAGVALKVGDDYYAPGGFIADDGTEFVITDFDPVTFVFETLTTNIFGTFLSRATPYEFYEYADNNGDPMYDTTTGAPLISAF